MVLGDVISILGMRVLTVLFIGLAVAYADPTIDVTYTVQGTTTTVRGMDHPYGRSFRGIPFARPPIGDLRFTVNAFPR